MPMTAQYKVFNPSWLVCLSSSILYLQPPLTPHTDPFTQPSFISQQRHITSHLGPTETRHNTKPRVIVFNTQELRLCPVMI